MENIIKAADMFPKVLPDFKKGSSTGGVVTIVTFVMVVFLLVFEIRDYATRRTFYEATVDTSRTDEQGLNINIDISVATSCEFLSADVVDVSGDHYDGFSHNLTRRPVFFEANPGEQQVDSFWNPGPAFHVPGLKELIRQAQLVMPYIPAPIAAPVDNVLNKLSEQEAKMMAAQAKKVPDGNAEPMPIVKLERNATIVREKLRAANPVEDLDDENSEHNHVHNACRITGHLSIKKVQGNFHIAGGKSINTGGGHVHDLESVSISSFNFSHVIHRLSFGHNYPGLTSPLDNLHFHTSQNMQMYQYFIKVVPTEYRGVGGEVISTSQYAATYNARSINHDKGSHGLPGIFFNIDVDSLRVEVSESHPPFMHFLTRLCAIIGGVWAVAGMMTHAVQAGYEASLGSLRRRNTMT